jgi:hypothetical protein
MSAHTEGPWSVMWQNSRRRDFGGGISHWQVPVCVGERSRQGNVIAIVHAGGPAATKSDQETVEANARLIAAAPDMLAALRDIGQRVVTGDAPSGYAIVPLEAIEAAREAIANAGGRE